MNHSIENNPLDDLLAGYALGNLTIAEVDSLKQALKNNPELLQELQHYQDISTMLPLTLEGPAPSSNLKTKILDAVNVERSSTSSASSIHEFPAPIATTHTQQNSEKKILWPRFATSCLGILVLGLGLLNLGLRRQHQLQLATVDQDMKKLEAKISQLKQEQQSYEEIIASLKQPNVVVFNLASKNSGKISSASLLTIPGKTDLVLVANQLPALDPTKIYRLWALAEGASKPLYCGQFRHNETGTARWRSPNASCSQNPTQFMVTLDAPEDPISSAGPLVLEGEI